MAAISGSDGQMDGRTPKWSAGSVSNILCRVDCYIDQPDESQTTLFDKLAAEESKRLTSLPPSNAFEEMMRWTDEGKLWNFPIDNEQGTTALFCGDIISVIWSVTV